METVIVGAILWLLVGSFYWLLRFALLRFSIEREQERLELPRSGAATVTPGDEDVRRECIERIGLLRSLDAIVRTIFLAMFPFAMIILGMVMPASVREFLGRFVSADALVQGGLAALFGYIAVFSVWRQCVDFSAEKFIKTLVRAVLGDSGMAK